MQDLAYRFPDNVSVDEGFHDRTALRDPSKPNTYRRMKAKLKVEPYLCRVYLPPFSYTLPIKTQYAPICVVNSRSKSATRTGSHETVR
ncbi:hypothetical protein BT69DRAFT_267779 [Atractiella rhizophila]|nr:hypothetical protein BT69DRAFT_267779 [Atractiella rhizophila]